MRTLILSSTQNAQNAFHAKFGALPDLTFETAHDVESALKLTPEVIVFVAPELEGELLECLTHLRSYSPTVPIVLLVESFGMTPPETALRAGAQDCLLFDDVNGASLVRALTFAVERTNQIVQAHNSDGQFKQRYKSYENALQSYQQQHNLLESTDAIVCMIDANARVQFINRRVASLFETTLEEVQGKFIFDLLPQPLVGTLVHLVNQVISYGTGIIEEVSETFFGELHWMRLSVQPVHNAYGIVTGALLNAVDISDRKRAEIMHEKSEIRLRGLLAIDEALLSNRPIVEIAAQALDHMRLLIPYNHALVGTFEPDELTIQCITARAENSEYRIEPDNRFVLPQHVRSLIAGMPYLLIDDLHAYNDPIFDFLYTRGIRAMLCVGLKHDDRMFGLMVLYSTSTNSFTFDDIQCALEIARQMAVAIHTMMLDHQIRQHAAVLEERVKERTAELERAKTRIEAIFESSSDAILLIDLPSGAQQVNSAYRQLVGANGVSSELAFDALAVEDDLPLLADALTHAIETQNSERVEIRAYRADGSSFYAEIGLAVVKGSPDYAPSVVCSIRDVTARRESALALERALAQEKELNNLKTQFVSMASHEFRTPLTTILATTDTLSLYRARMDELQIEARLSKIRQQVGYMKTMMDDVLQLAKIESRGMGFNPKNQDIDALLLDIIEDFDNVPDQRGRIRYHPPTAPFVGCVDAQMIRHITSNLISNGLKYSPAPQPVNVTVTQQGSSAIITVCDEGIGIPAENIKHLFEPFYRANNVGKIAGTGLGLAIANQAIKAHGGTIAVQSEPNQGSTFVVSIPLHAWEAQSQLHGENYGHRG